MKPLVYLGADHAGYSLKESLEEHLGMRGFAVEDLGAHRLDETDDYPAIAARVAKAVLANPRSLGILSCGNAEGMAIAANKFDGIRAGVGFSIEAAKTMRTDDDANIICIPGRMKIVDDPLRVAEAFLATAFSGAERHERRLRQLQNIETSGDV